MASSRLAAPVVLAVVFAVSAPRSCLAEDAGHGAFKIQIGAGLLTQATGIVSVEHPGSKEHRSGPVAALAVLRTDTGRVLRGVRLEMDGNRVDVGPPVTQVGAQVFGIATIRITGQIEIRLRGRQDNPRESWQPFLSVGAGWNFNTVGTKIRWPLGSPPSGTPTSLDLDGSPALRVGAGLHSKGNERGLSVTLEGGWKWNAGEFRLNVQDRPDRRGNYNLSGVYLLIGVLLRL